MVAAVAAAVQRLLVCRLAEADVAGLARPQTAALRPAAFLVVADAGPPATEHRSPVAVKVADYPAVAAAERCAVAAVRRRH
jgi:hypothetical protein